MRKGLFILLLVVPIATYAQHKIVTVAEGEQAINPSVVINRKNPENFVMGCAAGLFYSMDSGKSWQKSQPQNDQEGVDHTLVSDRKGNLYDFHLALNSDGSRYDKIICQWSADGGVTWQVIGSISAPDKDIRYPKICAHSKSGEFLLSWTQYDEYGSEDPEKKSNIMLAQSKDGKKWSKPIQISQLSGDCRDDNQTPRGATPGINSRDMKFVLWSMNQGIYLDRSMSKDGTWLNNDIHVNDQKGGWSFNIPGLKKTNGLPTLFIDNSPGRYNGVLFAVWADQSKGVEDTDVWFLRSVNFGDNWSTPLRVNDDSIGKHQFMPAMTVDQSDGLVYIVYYDRRDHDDEQTDVYLAYSMDNGTTFKNVKISEQPFSAVENSDMGSYISIDAYKGTIVPVWTSYTDGKVSINTTIVKRDDLVKVAVPEEEVSR